MMIKMSQLELYTSTKPAPDHLAVRIVDRKNKLVIKLFDPAQKEKYSVKFWVGDFDKVVSNWNMERATRPLNPVERSFVAEAAKHLKRLASEVAYEE